MAMHVKHKLEIAGAMLSVMAIGLLLTGALTDERMLLYGFAFLTLAVVTWVARIVFGLFLKQ